MSLHEYLIGAAIIKADPPFYSLIMAAMQKADTENGLALIEAFPEVWEEVQARYLIPGGVLPSDRVDAVSILPKYKVDIKIISPEDS